MSCTNAITGESAPGASARSSARTKLSAVTPSLEGGENRKSAWSLNVYVFPSDETVGGPFAISGSGACAAAQGLSG
jgi:hypothetical protein